MLSPHEVKNGPIFPDEQKEEVGIEGNSMWNKFKQSMLRKIEREKETGTPTR